MNIEKIGKLLGLKENFSEKDVFEKLADKYRFDLSVCKTPQDKIAEIKKALIDNIGKNKSKQNKDKKNAGEYAKRITTAENILSCLEENNSDNSCEINNLKKESPQPEINKKSAAKEEKAAYSDKINDGTKKSPKTESPSVSAEILAIIDEICRCGTFEQEKAFEGLDRLYNILNDKPDEFEKCCRKIKEGSKNNRIKAQAWFKAGEFRRSRNEISEAEKNYIESAGEKHNHGFADFRLAHMYAFQEIESDLSAEDILYCYENAIRLAKNPPLPPEAWLEAAKINFEIEDLTKAKQYFQEYVKKSGNPEGKEYAQNMIDGIDKIHQAVRPDASCEDMEKAAVFYAGMTERKDEKLKFARPRTYFFEKTSEFFNKASSKARGKIKAAFKNKSRIYEDIKMLLEKREGNLTGENEFNLGKCYFEIGCIKEAKEHMKSAAEMSYPEADKRLAHFIIYEKAISPDHSAADIVSLGKSYSDNLGDFEKAEKEFKQVEKESLEAKKELFNLYFNILRNLDNIEKAKKVAEVLAETERNNGIEGVYYRESLAKIYFQQKDYKKTKALCKELMQLSHEAEYLYANMCMEEIEGCKKEDAIKYYYSSAKKGHPGAKYKLYLNMLETGDYSLDGNDYIPEDCLNEAADAGCVEALCRRAEINLGKKNEDSTKKALEDLKKASEEGHLYSAAKLMELYLKDPKNAKYAADVWINFRKRKRNNGFYFADEHFQDHSDNSFIKLLRTHSNEQDSVISFADMLLEIPEYESIQSAINLLKSKSDEDDITACARLGEIYFIGFSKTKQETPNESPYRRSFISGDDRVLKDYAKNLKQAKIYLEKSNKGNNKNIWSSYYLGLMYYDDEDFKSAIKNFKLSNLPAALYWQGKCYSQAKGVPGSPDTAENCYVQAFNQGFAPASFALAEKYKRDDASKCLYYYIKAVMQGRSGADDKIFDFFKGNFKKDKDIHNFFGENDKLDKEIENYIDNKNFSDGIIQEYDETLIFMLAVLLKNDKKRQDYVNTLKAKLKTNYWIDRLK